MGALTPDRRGDQLAVDPERRELALDAFGPPAVEPPAVLGEAVGEPFVVEVALLAQLPHDRVDDRGLDPLAGEHTGDLGDRVVTPVECAPRDVARVLEPDLRVGRPFGRQVARRGVVGLETTG